MLSTLKKIISKYYLVILLVVLLMSYGQTLLMLPWQDDNALFFKLAHIEEPAGFLGPGLFGNYAYKYTAFFYYPIYLLFGHQSFYYFTYGFFLYAVSAFMVYKVASSILGKNAGFLAGFLYATGYIGSDSFIRIFNSVVASLSVILTLLLTYTYWKFVKERKNWWFLGALFFFFLAYEFTISRAHYLIAIPILFEVFFLSFKNPILKSLAYSFVRIFLFLPIFYQYVIQADTRVQNSLEFISSILRGDFYSFYGFLSSLVQMFMPTWLTALLMPTNLSKIQTSLENSVFYFPAFFIILLFFYFFIIFKYPKIKFLASIFIVASLIWRFVSERIFISPALEVTPEQVFIAYLGGEMLLLASLGFFLTNKNYKTLYLLFLGGILSNLLSYSFYNPLQVYEKINRYFSHSFLFLILLLPTVFISIKNKKLSRIFLIVTVVWGLTNMFESFSYERAILVGRTTPIRNFYRDLTSQLPKINKDDILYFDQEDKARGNFADAFSVAQMPETTAIAWRYGIDRYDFKMFTETQDFFDYLKNNKVNLSQIHSFFYSNEGLKNTTDDLISFLKGKEVIDLLITKENSKKDLSRVDSGSLISKPSIEITNKNIPSLTPLTLVVDVVAKPLSFTDSDFPFFYGSENLGNDSLDAVKIQAAFDYKRFKDSFRKNRVESSSDWQGRIVKNLTDGDYGSVWEADRILWMDKPQFLIIETNPNLSFNRLFFVNAYSNHTLLEFEILGSSDKRNWALIKTFQNSERFKNGQEVVVDFQPQRFRYFKILFKKTLNTDAPAISELWLIPSKFAELDPVKTEKFLANPFASVGDKKTYDILLADVGHSGRLEVSWANNKNYGWQTSNNSFANIIFDGRVHRYEIPIPAGGTIIDKLKFTIADFPGEISILNIQVRY